MGDNFYPIPKVGIFFLSPKNGVINL